MSITSFNQTYLNVTCSKVEGNRLNILDNTNNTFLEILAILMVGSLVDILNAALFIKDNYWYEALGITVFYAFKYRLQRLKEFWNFPKLSIMYYVVLELFFIFLVRHTNELAITLFFIFHTINYESLSFISYCVLYSSYPVLTLSFMAGSLCATAHVKLLS